MPDRPRSISLWLGASPKFQCAFAICAVMLSTGGLVLYKAPSSSAFGPARPLVADGKNASAFSGPGVHGVLSLSHTRVLSQSHSPIYAEVRLAADAVERAAV